MAIQFDEIGEKYDPIKRFPVIRYGETFTVQKMLGDISGKSVIDLACGTGFYTRMLKKMGASRVVGVDVSEEMLNVARQQEAENPLGIRYMTSDVVALIEEIGRFDIVLAVYLLNYADSDETLRAMLQKTHDLLAPNGQLIAYTFNPEFTLRKGNASKYKFTVAYRDEYPPVPHRHPVSVTVNFESPVVIKNYQWDAIAYQQVASRVGFRELVWHPVEVSSQGVEEYGQGFWAEYLDNSIVSGFRCVK